MRILLVEPFFTGSHKSWAQGLQQHSRHDIEILELDGRFWKWRMQLGDILLAEKLQEDCPEVDMLLLSDMLDVPSFLAQTKDRFAKLPTSIYFHENQLSYPWSEQERNAAVHQRYLSLINIKSALSVDRCFFNSNFHLQSFLTDIEKFVAQDFDLKPADLAESIEAKSKVLPLGVNLGDFSLNSDQRSAKKKTILWNHRWEYDKGPEEFFGLLYKLSDQGFEFDLIVLGQSQDTELAVFAEARQRLDRHIVHFGFVESRERYTELLQDSTLMPVLSRQDFFGASIVEAISHGVLPLLPQRLSYPELFRLDENPEYFYASKADLEQRMKAILSGAEEAPSLSPLAFLETFDWKNIIAEYDQEFEALLEHHSGVAQ